MARVPEIIRRNPLSQVAAQPPVKGQGWTVLAELADTGAGLLKNKAGEQAREMGFNAVMRDVDGSLKVNPAADFGGFLADQYNTAAYAKYLSQRKIDMAKTFTELAQQNEFDPAGFRNASEAYIRSLREEEDVPTDLKEELLLDAQQEAESRFNGLYNAQTQRNYRDAETNTRVHRDMLVDDYVNLYMNGDFEAAEQKLKEIESLTSFRVAAPYISETGVEGDLAVRSARALAKFSYAVERMVSADEWTQELEDEMNAILKDEDLLPAQQVKLKGAIEAQMKGAAAKSIAKGLSDSTYSAKVRRVESSGNNTAQNPKSSAYGPFQFIKSTWRENVRELMQAGGAEWARGLGDTELLAMRADPQAAQEVFDWFTRKNEIALENAGLPVNDDTRYLAHFLGPGGAVALLTSAPGDMVRDIMPANVIEANPFLQGYTVAEMRNWAARKMTVKASDIIAGQNRITMIEDAELRGMALSELNRQYDIRRAVESDAQMEYEERLRMNDSSLTENEIMSDHNLSDDAQADLTTALRKARDDVNEVTQTLAQINAGGFFNPGDSNDRSRIDNAFNSLRGDRHPMDPENQVLAGQIAAQTGILPRTSFGAVLAATKSNDPAAVAQSMEFLHQVLERRPGAIDHYANRADVMGAYSDYQFYSGFMGAEEAAQKVAEIQQADPPKNVTQAASDAAKNLEVSDVTGFLSEKGVTAEIGNEDMQAALMSDYQRLFTDAYLQVGNTALAKNRALNDLSRIYGPNQVTGTNMLMRYPPQNFYPMPVVEMQTQVKSMLDEIGAELPGPGFWSSAGRAVLPLSLQGGGEIRGVTMVSDQYTRAEIARGEDPSYLVFYTDKDGTLQQAPKRMAFERTSSFDAAGFDEQQEQGAAVQNMRIWRERLRAEGMTESEALNEVLSDRERYSQPPPQE